MCSMTYEKVLGGSPGQGRIVARGTISFDVLARCPKFLFSPDHYRDDGSCKCNDPNHDVMRDHGYVFENGGWR